MPVLCLLSGSKLGYCAMVFTRDGERLAALGHPREPKLFVWSVETEVGRQAGRAALSSHGSNTRGVVVSVFHQVKLVEALLPGLTASVSFNPSDRDVLATSTY